MHSQPPKSPTPLIRGERQRRRSPNPPAPLSGGVSLSGELQGTLETSLGSELLVNVYLFLAFTINTWCVYQPMCKSVAMCYDNAHSQIMSRLKSIELNELFPIFVDNVVNRFLRKPREFGSLDNIVYLMLPGDNLFRSRGGKIGTENQLVALPRTQVL